jgi:hypothetical protein
MHLGRCLYRIVMRMRMATVNRTLTALCRFLKQPKLLESFMYIVAAAYLQYTALH